jgi:hypothetical protein
MHTIRQLRFEAFEDRRMLSFTTTGYDEGYAFSSAIVTADFNEDGRLDLATAGNGNVRVRLGDGTGAFGAPQQFSAGTIGPYQLEVADFNNDAKLDILVVYDVADLGTSLLMGNGDGTFQSAFVTDSSWLEITAVAVGHFNGDNKVDLVVGLFEWDSYGGYVQVRLGDSEGGFTGSNNDPYQSSLFPPDEAMAVDLNNDGKLDVVTSGVGVFLGNGDGTLASSTYYPTGGAAIASGDFTGEGNADVIVAGNSVAVFRGGGDGSLDAPLYHSANGTTHTAVATADFNADGKLDAVVTDGDTGTVSLMLGNGDGTLSYTGAFATGISPSAVTVGDFNRDGRPDVAVANRLSGTVSVLLNDGVWPVEPNLIGDYNLDQNVDAADYVMWRKMQGSTVTPWSGADGDGDGVVDHDDYGVWRAHFGQIVSPPAAGNGASAAAETDLASPQVSDEQQAVEKRGAGENQRAKMARDSAFVGLAVPLATSVARPRPNGRPLESRIMANDAIRRDAALLKLLSQPDSKKATTEGDNGDEFDKEEANNAYDLFFDSVVDAVASHLLFDA